VPQRECAHWGEDAPAVAESGVAADGGVGHGEDAAVVKDAAAVNQSGVAADGAAGDSAPIACRGADEDAAAAIAGDVAADRAVQHGEVSLVIEDAPAVRVGGVAADGAVLHGDVVLLHRAVAIVVDAAAGAGEVEANRGVLHDQRGGVFGADVGDT